MTPDLLRLLFNRHSPFVGDGQKDNALVFHVEPFSFHLSALSSENLSVRSRELKAVSW